MRTLLASAALLLLASTAAMAEEKKKVMVGDSVDVHPWTGDQYVKQCTSKVDERVFACLMYTRGIADGIIVRSKFSKDEHSVCIPTKDGGRNGSARPMSLAAHGTGSRTRTHSIRR
jgi:hypothetical protein